jgi:hypothetical protein
MTGFFSQEARKARARRFNRCTIAGAAAAAVVTLLASWAHAPVAAAAKTAPGQHKSAFVLASVFVATAVIVTTATMIIASYRAARNRRKRRQGPLPGQLPGPGRAPQRAPAQARRGAGYDDDRRPW